MNQILQPVKKEMVTTTEENGSNKNSIIIDIKALTRPTIAEPRNLTQSIGVNPGFFFSGFEKQKYQSQVMSHASFEQN